MRKFFVKQENIKEEKIDILGTDVNHIKNVLRLKIGDKIQIGNSQTSQNYICEIISLDKQCVKTKILEEIESQTQSNVILHIFQGLPKADKMELILQKGTELGVSEFIPVAFQRSIVKLAEKEEKKLERWRKVVEMAAKQSHRDNIPKIRKTRKVKDICQLVAEYDSVLLAYEEERQNTLKKELITLKDTKENLKIAVIIGPEGGIEKQEVDILKQAGAKVISLGDRILRTETVVLQVASIIMYELEKAN